MVTCPNCNHEEMLGAMFCSECGARLDAAEGWPTNNFDSPFDFSAEEPVPPAVEEPPFSGARLLLHLYHHNAYIRLENDRDYSLGRISEGQKVLPDIDLAAYDAYKNGVSRVHASIMIEPRRISVLDLGSSNGTILNGRRLTPQVPYALSDGDILVLGKLESRVLINLTL